MASIVSKAFEDSRLEFTRRVQALGFRRTRAAFWTRPGPATVDVIHLFRCGSSYSAPGTGGIVSTRVHFAIKVLNDVAPTVWLDGPTSDASAVRAGRFHLEFHSVSRDMFERCADDLERFVVEHGEPWFARFADPNELLRAADSPLSEASRAALRRALDGDSDPACVGASCKELGLAPSDLLPR